jgi:mannonate dehydratase
MASRHIWTLDELVALKASNEAEGLTLEALENFDPGQWYEVLLDGPERDAQMENLKTIIRSVGDE